MWVFFFPADCGEKGLKHRALGDIPPPHISLPYSLPLAPLLPHKPWGAFLMARSSLGPPNGSLPHLQVYAQMVPYQGDFPPAQRMQCLLQFYYLV